MALTTKEARERLLAGDSKTIRVDGSIDLSGTDVSSIDASVFCNDLDLSGTPIASLPAKVKVRSHLNLDNCKSLQRLPKGLTCGSLSLQGCSYLDRLPEGLSTWFLNARDCPRLSIWPKAGEIRNGNVSLRNCTEIRSLPEWLGPLGQLNLVGLCQPTPIAGGASREWMDRHWRVEHRIASRFSFSDAASMARRSGDAKDRTRA